MKWPALIGSYELGLSPGHSFVRRVDGQPILKEVSGMQYEGTLQPTVVAVLADDRFGVVRMAERAERPGHGVSYTGVHVWEFRDGRCCRHDSLYDDAYAQFWAARTGPTG